MPFSKGVIFRSLLNLRLHKSAVLHGFHIFWCGLDFRLAEIQILLANAFYGNIAINNIFHKFLQFLWFVSVRIPHWFSGGHESDMFRVWKTRAYRIEMARSIVALLGFIFFNVVYRILLSKLTDTHDALKTWQQSGVYKGVYRKTLSKLKVQVFFFSFKFFCFFSPRIVSSKFCSVWLSQS